LLACAASVGMLSSRRVRSANSKATTPPTAHPRQRVRRTDKPARRSIALNGRPGTECVHGYTPAMGAGLLLPRWLNLRSASRSNPQNILTTADNPAPLLRCLAGDATPPIRRDCRRTGNRWRGSSNGGASRIFWLPLPRHFPGERRSAFLAVRGGGSRTWWRCRCWSALRAELRVTADLYSHLRKQTAAKAARRMDAVLNGAAKACDASQTLRALR
jgi:hypothetical protein